MPISFVPWARKPATRESGPAFTTRWTTSPACSLGSRSPEVFISWAENDGSLLIPTGTESVELTGSIDGPAEGAIVTGDLTVSGWARTPGGDLGVTVLIDGAPRYAIREVACPAPGRPGGASLTRRLLDRGLRELLRVSSRRQGRARAFGRLPGPGRPRAPLPVAEVHLERGSVESARPVGVQWELPGAVARRDQSHALGFPLNPGP